MDHLHSQLAAADIVLSAGVLDAIDAIVACGTRCRLTRRKGRAFKGSRGG
jgi:hypothetical protein